MPSHYLNQFLFIVNWTLGNKLQWNFNQNAELFIHENAYENNFCEMAAILSRGGELTRVIICNCFTRMQLLTHARVPVLIWIISVSRRVPWWMSWRSHGSHALGQSGSSLITRFMGNMGPIWGRQDPGGPHVGPMNFAIWGSVAVMTFKPNANYPKRMGRAPGFQLPGHPPTTMV